MSKFHVIADTHNVPALKKVLVQLSNIISLGDIAAVETEEYYRNVKRYSASWKGYKKNLPDFSDEDRSWFERVNQEGWFTQMDSIINNAKSFTVTMGNSDEYMINYIPGVKESLAKAQKENQSFTFKQSVELIQTDNIQLLFLPYRKTSFEEDLKLLHTDSKKPLFIFGHCPPYEKHEKEYYIMHHAALEFLLKDRTVPTYYFHGHIHADKTYLYTIPSLQNVTLISPKAPDTEFGINWDHDYIEIDTITAQMKVFNLESKKQVGFSQLPDEYRTKEDHWNDFILEK